MAERGLSRLSRRFVTRDGPLSVTPKRRHLLDWTHNHLQSVGRVPTPDGGLPAVSNMPRKRAKLDGDASEGENRLTTEKKRDETTQTAAGTARRARGKRGLLKNMLSMPVDIVNEVIASQFYQCLCVVDAGV